MSFTKGPQTHCNNVEKVQLTHSEQVVHFKVAFLLSFHSAGICFYYLSFSSTLTKKVFCFCFFFKSNPMSYFPPLPYPLFSPLSCPLFILSLHLGLLQGVLLREVFPVLSKIASCPMPCRSFVFLQCTSCHVTLLL